MGCIIILGAAPTNRATEPVIEGGAGGLGGGLGTKAGYGGTNPADNSGILRYVRVEYPGYRFSANNEINGITFGGVGSGTVLEYVQVSYSLDDGFEWFGGTVNGKYLIALGSQDDDFDTDFGYRGNLQFLFSMKDPQVWDSDASNGFESDNDGSGTGALPFTSAKWSNVTVVGPLRVDGTTLPVGSNHQDGLRLRRNTQLKIFNSVIMGFPNGINVPDSVTGKNANDGNLVVSHTSVQSATPLKAHASFNIASWFNTPAFNNNGSTARTPGAVNLTNMNDLHSPDARPLPGTELATAPTSFTSLTEPFFTGVTYRGAFDPAKSRSEQWDWGWAVYNPNAQVNTNTMNVNVAPSEYALEQNYPNPFNPSTTIRFAVPQAGMVSLKIYDMMGREVKTFLNGVVASGTHTVTLDARNLASGIYLYVLQAPQHREAKRMMLLK